MSRYNLFRHFFFTIALICFVKSSYAQEEIAVIPVSNINLRSLRYFEFSDSVFITYREKYQGVLATRYKLIKPDKSLISLELPELDKKDIVLGRSQGDSLYFYFVTQFEKENFLDCVVLNKSTGKKKFSSLIPFPKTLIGILRDNSVLTVNESDSTIRIKRVVDDMLINVQRVKVPAELINKRVNRSVIEHFVEASPSMAESPLKFYTVPGGLNITLDNVSSKKGEANSFIFKSRFEEKSIYQYRIPYASNNNFRSFLHADLLYRVSKDSKGLYLQIFDSVKTMVGSFSINRSTTFKDSLAYIRGSDSKRVLASRTVWDAISNNADVFVSVERFDSTRVLLKLGGHHAVEGTVGGPGVGHSLISLAASLVARAIIQAASNYTQESTDLYFYMIGNAQEGFKYSNGNGLTSKAIDAAELYSSSKSDEYNYKGYMQNELFITAVYCKREKNEVLRVVRYAKE